MGDSMQREEDHVQVLAIVQGLLKPVLSVVLYQTISMLWYSKYMFDKLVMQLRTHVEVYSNSTQV